MRTVICCWCDRSPEEFESNVPLYFSGKRNLSLGFSNDIDLAFLTGYEHLGVNYQGQLKDAGYRLHDAESIYKELDRKYAVLDVFGDYEKKCFLRWLVLSFLFPGEALLHLDGDIVLNEDPSVIARLLERRTFVLQGCPALTCISDPAWFSQYRNELDTFTGDLEGYSARAWAEREGWEESEREKWAGQRFRYAISSDQDLLSHLIHTDRIVQDRPAFILQGLDAYMLFENPMYLHGYENNLRHATYERRNSTDYVNSKRVLIWHMQSDFNAYLGKFIFKKKYLGNRLKTLSNDLVEKDFVHYLYVLFVRYLNGATSSRLNVYQYFFQENDFSEVLTDRTWWHKGAFV